VNKSPKRVLLAYLNTGGGHRSTAHAVAETLRNLYGGRVHVDLVDVTAEYFSWPLSELSATYRALVQFHGWPWALTYHLTNGPRRLALLRDLWWHLTSSAVQTLLDDHSPDVVVCCHPLLKAPFVQALRVKSPEKPLITLVTDLASGHASWFVCGNDRCLVATEQARERAITCGVPSYLVEMTGLPAKSCFVDAAQRDPGTAREKLGLDPDGPVVLLLSGADGVGPLCRLVKAIVDSGVKAELAVITGRNDTLRRDIASRPWSLPVHARGFVEDIHEWMLAADLLVTKAGPSTISEALIMGLPMVLSGALPGQERPNVDYVAENGAGVWAPTPREAAAEVVRLLESERALLDQMSERAQSLARPGAARRVAKIIWESAQGRLA
jgi:1,2-diacylglycerol 3-beta-galactosyltransferase